MVGLQIVAVVAGAFWVVAGVRLCTRREHRGRAVALGLAAVVVGTTILVVTALWILAQTPLSGAQPEGTGFPALP